MNVTPVVMLSALGSKTVSTGVQVLTTKVISGTAKVISGTAKVISGTAKVISGTAKVLSGTAKVISGTAKVISGTAHTKLFQILWNSLMILIPQKCFSICDRCTHSDDCTLQLTFTELLQHVFVLLHCFF